MQKEQYLPASNLPEWTKSASGITMALTLPERGARFIGLETRTACLLCDEAFGVPSQQPELLEHLLIRHRFVIGDVDQVADFKEYFDYWEGRGGSPVPM